MAKSKRKRNDDTATFQPDELTFRERYRIAKMLDTGQRDRRITRQTGCTPEYLESIRERLRNLQIDSAPQLVILDYVSVYREHSPDHTPEGFLSRMAADFGASLAEINHHTDAFLTRQHHVVQNRLQLDYALNADAIPLAKPAPAEPPGLRGLDSSHTLIHPEHWPGTMSHLVSRLWREFLIEIQNEEDGDDERPTNQEDQDRATALYQACELQTQRIIIDTEQFNEFVRASDKPLPDDAFANMRWPFDSTIYIELTEPTLYRDEDRDVTFHGIFIFGYGDVRTVCFALFADDTFHLPAINIDVTSGLHHDTPDENPPESPAQLAKVAAMTITYLTARSIAIVEEPLARNVRRRLERKQLPNPFHVVTTQTPRRGYRENEDPQPGSRHSYRYDVIGHIRFGRHLLADGTHRVTREWVRPHQRGLRNLRYVPATRRYYADQSE